MRFGFSIRQQIIAVAVVAFCISSLRWITGFQLGSGRVPGPAKVSVAAKNEVPGLVITSVRPSIINGQEAWEVAGTDQKGIIWVIYVWDSGKVIYAEPISRVPPPSIAEPAPDF